jgi:hypothetical protein
MGNGIGKSLFFMVNQEDLSASLNSHSFEDDNCEKIRRMVCFGGWCRTVISFGDGVDNHSLGQIHSLHVSLCLV